MSEITSNNASAFLDKMLKEAGCNYNPTFRKNVKENVKLLLSRVPDDGNYTRLLWVFEQSETYRSLRPSALTEEWLIEHIINPIMA